MDGWMDGLKVESPSFDYFLVFYFTQVQWIRSTMPKFSNPKIQLKSPHHGIKEGKRVKPFPSHFEFESSQILKIGLSSCVVGQFFQPIKKTLFVLLWYTQLEWTDYYRFSKVSFEALRNWIRPRNFHCLFHTHMNRKDDEHTSQLSIANVDDPPSYLSCSQCVFSPSSL
jgi:hypothetical protein